MSRGSSSGYIPFARREFAQSACCRQARLDGVPKPHSRASGDRRRLAILHALARYNHPLTAGEIVEKTGLPRRTVHYYLNKLLDEGLIVRVGKPPLSYYELTNLGKKAVFRGLLTVQTDPRRGRRVALERGARGSSRVTVWVGRVDNELRFRAGWAAFRRAIRVATGRDVTGLRYRHIYTRGGVLHYDSRHPYAVEDPYGDLLGVMGNLVVAASFLKGLVGGDVVWRLVEEAPVAEFVVVEQGEILRWG